jgi:ATP-dependent DNA helicase RecG
MPRSSASKRASSPDRAKSPAPPPWAAALTQLGPKRWDALFEAGIQTPQDLLTHIPFRYVDHLNPQRIADLKEGDEAYFAAEVVNIQSRASRLHIQVDDGSGKLDLVFFQGLQFLQRKFTVGQRLSVSGKVGAFSGLQIAHPEWMELKPGQTLTRALIPRYSLSEGMAEARVDHKKLQGWVFELLALSNLPMDLSESDRHALELGTLSEMFRRLHAPESWGDVGIGRRELKLRELLPLHRRLSALRATRRGTGKVFPRVEKWETALLQATPFEPTLGQKNTAEEIAVRLRGPDRFFGLLQGDVGSGKTWVAVYSALPVLAAGSQVALLAPTEILARQHARNLSPWLNALGVKTHLLVGGMAAPEKAEVLDALSKPGSAFVIGTHALLSDTIQFSDLGLCIVDEQHRFGVEQRSRLAEKGGNPHVLYLSATPIPRSLALSFFGDLESFQLTEKPPGRLPVKTRVVSAPKRADLIRFLEEESQKGGRIFWVVPRITAEPGADAFSNEGTSSAELSAENFDNFRGNEDGAAATVEDVAKSLRAGKRTWKIAEAHGRLTTEKREAALKAFREGAVQVLVATTVIEVGVDIPEADWMVVESAHRFGLAQLHQLRGRTGRGGGQGWCFLPEPPNGFPPQALERLQGFAETDDGFALAELDMRQRGVGHLVGLDQSGFGGLRFADVLQDFPLMEKIREVFGDET